MSSSTKIQDYNYLQNPERLAGITPENAEILRRWIDRQRINGLALTSISTNVVRISSWARIIGESNPATSWTVEEIESAYIHKMDDVAAGRLSSSTLDGELRALKVFWKYLNPDKPPLNIYRKPTKNLLLSSDYASVDQVLDMRNAAECQGDIRDAAIIMLLLGTGCRLGEIFNANVKDVKLGRQFGKIRVDGKTGERIVPFVTGLPELARWINMHPARLPDGTVDQNAPLFVTYQSRGHSTHRLSKRGIQNVIHKYGMSIDLHDVKFNPHAFRHRAASEDAHSLTNKELSLKFGWSPYSDMPARYTHTSDEELERSVLSAAGVVTPDVKPRTATTIQCQRCRTVNRAGAMFCDVCGLILDQSLAVQMAEIKGDMMDTENLRTYVDYRESE